MNNKFCKTSSKLVVRKIKLRMEKTTKLSVIGLGLSVGLAWGLAFSQGFVAGFLIAIFYNIFSKKFN